MRITFLGHSCFHVDTAGTRLVIDPWLTGNPSATATPAEVPCEFVLCTHAHDDHSGDALALAKLHGATIVAPFELANHFAARGVKTIDLMPGGGRSLPWGRVQMTPAIHSSSFELADGQNLPMGVASGFVIEAEGCRLYHAGDTALFSDLRLIGRHGLDLALLPIGDHYTMGVADALDALDLLNPRITVPMHYNTHPGIAADDVGFKTQAAARGHAVHLMKSGDHLDVGPPLT